METPPPMDSPPAPPAPAPSPPTQPPRPRFWSYLGASVALVAALVAVPECLPDPVPASAPPAEFSEARAFEVVDALCRRIGLRVSGTAGQRAAAEYLRGQLAAIPRLEVATQEAPVMDDPDDIGLVVGASITNVVARLPGELADAVVVSAHYDSPPESVGAADNAAAVGVALELARALAAGPRLRPTVIFNFNDAEEMGLLGSAAFLTHPWKADVRAFINLDAAGATGRALLFQTSAGSIALARAYAAAPRPLGTVLAQDIFQSGVIPSGTDFVVYARQGKLPGLDLALYRDGYAYHTDRDRPERLAPGTLQHLGDNLLATLRALELEDIVRDADSPPPWYFDLLGRVLVVLPAAAGWWLCWAALALGLGVGAWTARRRALRPAKLLLATGLLALAVLVAVLSAIIAAIVIGWAIGRPHAWFAQPWLVVAYGLVALGALAALVRRACPRRVAPAELAVGALGLWLALLLLATLSGAGSAYIPLVWVLALSAVVALGDRAPAARFAAWSVAAIVLAQPTLMILQVFLPIAGRLPIGPSFDPVAAALIALPVVLGAIGLAAPFAAAPLPRQARWGAGAAIGLGLILLVILPPFSSERPQRIDPDYACRAAGCAWRVTSEDSLGAAGALGDAPTETWPRPQLTEPRVTVTPGATTPAGREIILDIEPAAALEVTIRLPREGVLAWSAPVPYPQHPQIEDGSSVYLRRITPTEPWRVRLTVPRDRPLPVKIRHRWAPSPEVQQALLARLPAWTTLGTTVSWTHEIDL